eukprot:UN01134
MEGIYCDKGKKNKNKSLLFFTDKKEEGNDKNDVDMLKMTMFAIGKPFGYIMKNGVIQMSLCLIIKMELIFKYIAIDNNNQYVLEIYICVCCVLLSYAFICNNNHNNVNEYKQ